MQVGINGQCEHIILFDMPGNGSIKRKGDSVKRHNKWLCLILYILSAEVIGMSSGLIAGSFTEFFEKYNQPPLLPPALVFPVVWIILYAVMGISAHIIHYSDAAVSVKRKLLTVYWAQLIVNFLWSIIFVRFELLWLAAADIALLLILIGIMILGFGKVKHIAGNINIPYFLWVAFATYLNIATIFVN